MPMPAERAFLVLVMLLGVAGFWKVYLGPGADPGAHHHLHLATIAAWLALLWTQLGLVTRRRYREHRRIGLAVLGLGPLLVAASALLTVHSAQKGLASGQGDFLVVQNVAGTLELALFILLAFVVRKRRGLHGSFLLATSLQFFGVALFFTLIGFVPGFRIEGPETFHRFASAALAAQGASVVVGVLFFLRAPRDGWPWLLAAACVAANEGLRMVLSRNDLAGPLTETVAAIGQPPAFFGALVLLLAGLLATGVGRPAARGAD